MLIGDGQVLKSNVGALKSTLSRRTGQRRTGLFFFLPQQANILGAGSELQINLFYISKKNGKIKFCSSFNLLIYCGQHIFQKFQRKQFYSQLNKRFPLVLWRQTFFMFLPHRQTGVSEGRNENAMQRR